MNNTVKSTNGVVGQQDWPGSQPQQDIPQWEPVLRKRSHGEPAHCAGIATPMGPRRE